MKGLTRPSWAILALVLLLGLALRMALWGAIPRTGLISDEGEYLSAAAWLAEGRGFDWYQDYLWTRAPIYPLFVAAHMLLFGNAATALYASQIVLSLIQIVLVYRLASLLSEDQRIIGSAALLTALFLPLALYTQIALSETLYITLLLAGFLALMQLVRSAPGRPFRQLVLAALAGLIFGLATLTRSLTLGFLPFVVLWLFWGSGLRVRDSNGLAGHFVSRSALSTVLAFSMATLLTIMPWTVYSSRMYAGTVLVDTSGAFNLLLGGRTAYDGKRSDAQVRDYVLGLLGQSQSAPVGTSCTAYPGQLRSQAARQRAMTSEGLCLIAARPAAFVQKSLSELIDLFQINYTGAERFTDGFSTGRLAAWYVLALFFLDDSIYVFTLPLAILGWALVKTQGPKNAADQPISSSSAYLSSQVALANLVGLWWLYNMLVAPLLFAINRFRIPLMPFAFLFVPFGCLWLWDILRSCLKRGQQASTAQGTTVNSGDSSVPRPQTRSLASPRRGGSGLFRQPLRSFGKQKHSSPRQAIGKERFSCESWSLRDKKKAPSFWMTVNAILAVLLFLIAATPYAYFEPRADGADSRWASYLGPYPSSLDISIKALGARAAYAADQRFAQALAQGDLVQAEQLLQSGTLGGELRRLGPALVAARQGQIEAALALLPASAQIDASKDVPAGVLRGDLLRRQGSSQAALDQLSIRYIDDANPLEWAWTWLTPAATRSINVGGSTDIGYLRGCYPGEGDPAAGGNFRWCTDAAQLRFPGAGTASPQTLTLRVDGRAWKLRATQAPELSVWLGDTLLGKARPALDAPTELRYELPATQVGSALIFTLRTDTFVPDAKRYNSQQGDLAGQVQYLGVRLDWAELGPTFR